MNSFSATRSSFSSRSLRVVVALEMSLAILGVGVSVSAAEDFFSTPAAAPVVESVSTTIPFILPVEDGADAQMQAAAAPAQNCRDVATQIDEGYGVRGGVIHTVCGKAL